MTTFEIIMSIATSGIFSALLALFYRFGRNQERIDNSFKSIEEKLVSMDTRLSNVEREIQGLNTRVAVIESRMTGLEIRANDISTNVTHLMWHHQALPQKEAKEE